MHLKRIELQGFKSFASKTVLEFNKGISCVVGPNGSGKSNIADAVRWVLGEQSAKQLRGSKMLDMIFSGTQYRRSVGYAQVSVVFDNEDQVLPIEYTEVVITRRLYKNGDSEYSINNNDCRLKDVLGLFYDTGIGKEGYSIIGQGKIQEILSAKSEDRRGVFEEAAGIMKYKVKKLEAQRKLQKTEDNLIRLGDIVNELKIQLGPLKEQSIVAKEFLDIRDRLKILEVGLYLNNLNGYKKRLIRYDEDIKINEQYVNEENINLENFKQENIDRNNDIQVIEEKEEIKRKELNEYIMSIETTLHEISIANEKINSIKNSIKRNLDDIIDIEQKQTIINSDYLKREERIEYFKNQYEKFSTNLNQKQNEINNIIKSLGDREKEIEQLKFDILEEQDKISDIKILVRTLENENNSINETIQIGDKDLHLSILEKDKIFLLKQELENENKKIISSKKLRIDEHEKYKNLLEKNSNNEKENRESLEKTRTKLGIYESNLKIVTDMEKRMDGYRHSVKSVIEATKARQLSLDGVCEIFGKLISVDDKYEVAIEAALGGNIQNIVVETEQSAKKAISYLKTNNNGRATFMPLNSIRRNRIKEDIFNSVKNQKGFINTGDKLVEYDMKYDNAVSNLLGKIVIVESFEDATRISRNIRGDYKIVTLEGDFFNIGGTISGGSLGRKGTRILGREKNILRLKKDIITAKENIEKYEQLAAEYDDSKNKLLTTIYTLENEINLLNEKIIRSETGIIQLNTDYNKIENKIDNRKKVNYDLLQKKEQNIKVINERRNTQEQIELNINKMKIKIAEFEVSHLDERNKRDELHLDISDLKVSTNSALESINNTTDTLSRLSNEIKELVNRKEIREIDIEELKKKQENLQSDIELKSKIVENPKEKEDDLKFDLNALSLKRKNYEEENGKFIEIVSGTNKKIIDFQNKISKINVSKAKIESEMKAMQDRMWDEYGLTHNEALEKHNEIENITEARKEIKVGKKRINELGLINVHAIEDYKKTNERYVFLEEQCEDLEKSKRNLYRIISEMNTIMKKLFVEKFDIINRIFERVFKELFDGGRARIELVDKDDVLESGIDIIVQPPGKRLQNMMLLSGGEKALTAISLIFAILEMNPSPFCIFDEIEAALDDTNVIKFAEYINAYKEKTQFILITHRKGSMENSDSLYGVTMQEHGVSKVVSMKMTD